MNTIPLRFEARQKNCSPSFPGSTHSWRRAFTTLENSCCGHREIRTLQGQEKEKPIRKDKEISKREQHNKSREGYVKNRIVPESEGKGEVEG